MKAERTIYTYSTRQGAKKVETIEVDEVVWKLSCIKSCVDYDRCNERHEPSGSCDDCITDTKRIIEECNKVGIRIDKL